MTWKDDDYEVKRLVDNGQRRAVAHLEDAEHVVAVVPCCRLRLKEYVAPSPPAQLPSCPYDVVQLAYAIVKENMLHLERPGCQRPTEVT